MTVTVIAVTTVMTTAAAAETPEQWDALRPAFRVRELDVPPAQRMRITV